MRFVFFLVCCVSLVAQGHPLYDVVKSKAHSGFLDKEALAEFVSLAQNFTDSHGRATKELQEVILDVERDFGGRFDPGARATFQTLVAEVGAQMLTQVAVPESQMPFWLLDSKEFTNYRSTPELPKQVDVVIIGAGLTGASAAYHLGDAALAGKSVIVIEKDHPAAQSSGRNGGNFQLLPETYIGHRYDGLVQERVESARIHHPDMDEESLHTLAEHHARVMVNFSVQNYHRLIGIVEREDLKESCDFSMGGWLRIPSSEYEEETLLTDHKWLGDTVPRLDLWSAEKIIETFRVPALYTGRMALQNGNYHPYKFVVQTLKKSMQKGVKLYTGIKVQRITPQGEGSVLLETSEGLVRASKVIVATNAFLPELFPELDEVKTLPSQILNYEHLTNHLNGATITERRGDHYYNFPLSKAYVGEDGVRRGMLHYGLDSDTFAPDAYHVPVDVELMQTMIAEVNARFPETVGQPPSRTWAGPMAITEDRTPIIGFMEVADGSKTPTKNVIIAAAFQGYGGSYCIEAGYVAAQMSLTGETPAQAPEDLFSPKRFL